MKNGETMKQWFISKKILATCLLQIIVSTLSESKTPTWGLSSLKRMPLGFVAHNSQKYLLDRFYSKSSNNNLRRRKSSRIFLDVSSKDPTSSSSYESKRPKHIYSLPAMYDLAFGYRDFEEEVTFLINMHKKYSSGNAQPQNVIELAAGPARHSITALTLPSSSIKGCVAIDSSPEMTEYSRNIADETLSSFSSSSLSSSRFEYFTSDVRNFTLPPTTAESHSVDTSWMLLGSMQHMTSNDDVVSLFRRVGNYLKENGEGTLILELPHPRETFMIMECTRNGWEVPLQDDRGEDSGELRIVWGDDGDEFDPISQVRKFTVQMELVGVEGEEDKMTKVREVVPMRLFTVQEIRSLAELSGIFDLVAMYGALDEDIDVRDEEEAYRLVCVLRTKVKESK